MSHTHADVLAAIQAKFPGRDPAEILALLERYGKEEYHNEKHRVQVAVVELSEGSDDKLHYMLECALVDYRDVLAWKQLGPLSPEEGAKLQGRVRSLIEKWGGKP